MSTLVADPPPGAPPVPPILPPKDGFLFLDREKFHPSVAGDLPAEQAVFMADSQVPWGPTPVETVLGPFGRARGRPGLRRRGVQPPDRPCPEVERGTGRQGRTLRRPAQGHGRQGKRTLEVVEYDRPHRLHNVVRSSYMQVNGTLTFEEVNGGTRLRWEWDMGLVGPMRVLSPVLALIGPQWERRNWVRLKQYMESGRR